MSKTSQPTRLIDYLVFVGPGKAQSFRVRTSRPNRNLHNSKPFPAILNRFPAVDHEDFELSQDVAFFCQPEIDWDLEDPKKHVFMLTNTETNLKTYGVCHSFPHLFDPPAKTPGETVCSIAEEDDVCIQEWDVLSMCILSKHPFFNFFKQALNTLAHFVQDFGETDSLWTELLNYRPPSPGSSHTKIGFGMSRRQRMLSEIVSWIDQLVSLEAPIPGSSLEVELEVDPALVIAYPSSSRLPLYDLSVHWVFKLLDVCTVIEIFKLVFSEHKVIVHSTDCAFASECVLTVQTLLYPVQYLYPVIPLLPTSMPATENLLGVPTPYFVGVCSSFLSNVHEIHLAEVWLVNLDTKEIKPPTFLDQPVLEFPYSILQLQADIRLAMDKLDKADVVMPIGGGGHVTQPADHVTSTPISTSQTPSQAAHKLSAPDPQHGTSLQDPPNEDSYRRHLEYDVDVMIRVAFVEFMFSVDVLGLIDQFLCIYRLFPRPVVSIRKSAFLSSYERVNSTVDSNFMRNLMTTQGVEYFFEWSLNPLNSAYEEIRRGVHEIGRVSDKQFHYIRHQAFKTQQACLYHSSPDSLLYQEMLTYKATQTTLHPSYEVQAPDEDSDWEQLERSDYYDGDSESSYFTEEERESSSSPIGREVGVVSGEASGEDLLDDVEVGYYSTRKVASPSEKEPQVVVKRQNSNSSTHLLPQTGQKLRRPNSMVTTETSLAPKADNSRKSLSFEDLSLVDPEHSLGFTLNRGSAAYLTSTEYLTAHQFDTDTDHTPRSLDHSVFSSNTSSEDELIHLTPQQQQRGTPHGSPALPRRSPHTPHSDRGPLRQLTPDSDSNQSSAPSDRVDFSTPVSTLPRQQHSYNEDSGGGHVARTILALSALNNSKTMDNQIVEIVAKVVGGQGLPWPKPAALKRLSTYEKTRVLILRHLEESLGVRTSNDVVLATNAQITQVGVSRAVYRGVLDLLKLLLHCVEEDFVKEPESPLYSVFLIFRIAFSVYFEPKTKSSLSFSLRSALSIGTSLLATDASREPLSPEEPPTQVTENEMVSDTSRTQPQAATNSSSQQNGGLDRQSSETSSVKSLSSLSLTPELASKQNRLSSILGSSHDDLMSQLVNSPRFYHPREGQDVKTFSFLYKELLKGQGSSRPFLVKKEFWSNVFMSTIDADRGYLGWNERTADLYSRYNTLPEVHRRTFGSEEDHLLSIIAHNLLVYMLMVGISPRNTMMLINNFTARTRLATFEEKLLQHTIRYVENNTSDNIDLSYLGLMALYSEIHPTISHIVHYGINMIAPVYKLQITDEALILRRFPDERISARLWNDRITLIEQNESRATVSVRYSDPHGEFAHHFHTKQYQKVYESLEALVHSSNSVQPLQQT